MSIKIIPERKIRICDVCEYEDNEVTGTCPICEKEYCEDCERQFLGELFGKDSVNICNSCYGIISNLDKNLVKKIKERLYKPIIDEMRKIVIVENLDISADKDDQKVKSSKSLKATSICRACNKVYRKFTPDQKVCRLCIKHFRIGLRNTILK